MSGAGPSGPRPLLWVICGAGRGVGKTHLALELCRTLPQAAYAKQGTSRRRPGKAESFFTTDAEMDAFLAQAGEAGRRHLVVESNALARRGRGDVVIFVAGEVPAGGRGPAAGAGEGHATPRGARPDAQLLRSLAHVVLDRGGSGPDRPAWRAALARAGLESALLAPVLGVLAGQAEWGGPARK
ncbi:MAG TPA: hypothetical protein VMS93_06790 [Candidatus Saccharimonadales bacterium]|nr:hypothetical protein [Candidatus Saccharimonadales bacterium]